MTWGHHHAQGRNGVAVLAQRIIAHLEFLRRLAIAKRPGHMPGQGRSRRLFSVLASACLLLVAATAQADIQISSASWSAGANQLTVSGDDAEANAVVAITYTDGVAIATTNADGWGNWSATITAPLFVPCRVFAQNPGSGAAADVSNAPSDCELYGGAVSINSTSSNRTLLPAESVAQADPFGNGDYVLLAANDLGMHCGDLDHRAVSILPPFNVLHAQVIERAYDKPKLLTRADVDVFYSAVSNPDDPVHENAPTPQEPVYKTNFWDMNPRGTGNSIAFDGYDPFYPPNILNLFPLSEDYGLPVPDVERLYLGDGSLHADQQKMPGVDLPFQDNDRQPFDLFVTDFPFFINFPFGYTKEGVNWFSAEGIPMVPYDDQGRPNAYPLMRVQATDSSGNTLASLDVVVPVSGEADCKGCHTVSADGGNGEAASVASGGSPRSGTAFTVARVSDDPQYGSVPQLVSEEWAADTNVVRLHDAKHGTDLANNTPVVCQQCHYSPALDLAQVGPLGGDPNNPEPEANGRMQRVHASNSRVLHDFHSQFTDLFPDDMPPPNDPRRLDENGYPEINEFVQGKLEETCYQCHPGKVTNCLRGAMFNGGLVCQDCHGGMEQVGDDFSEHMSVATPFPEGADLSKRVPWANEPGCQSCHTGDAMDNLTDDPHVIPSPDGVRLLQAYRTDDVSAMAIVATNRRFAENETDTGEQMLYRLSTGHGGVMCEGCHGSTHAIWPLPEGPNGSEPNDNIAAIQLQGHKGTLIECSTCHKNNLGNTLDGPHGMHPVGESDWNEGGHGHMFGSNAQDCMSCHGANGQGTVLSRMSKTRTLTCSDNSLPGCDGNWEKTITLEKGTEVSCGTCHANPI